jgi:hypothetical protein
MQAGRKLILDVDQNCETTASQVMQVFVSAGYCVIKSFDLHSAIETHSQCLCPEDICPCQMIVLLVYPKNYPPASLILDSDGLKTTISLVLDASQSIPLYWNTEICNLLEESIIQNKVLPQPTK